MAETAIEWTKRDGTVGKTWNPTTGCDKISPGCGLPRFDGDAPGGCYAMAMAKRLKGMGSAKYQNDGDPRTSGPGFGVTIHPDALDDPLKWRKPSTVFVNSMSDLFHARVPRDFIVQVFAVMALTPQHTYQILSKRPERMARIVGAPDFRREVQRAALERAGDRAPWLVKPWWPLRNVWLGTSIESDQYVRRADSLRETPAAVLFISAEPLLGPLPSLDLTDIAWLIAGGESGPGSRPMDLDWVRDLMSRCRQSGTAPFVKQLGSVWARKTPQIVVDGSSVSASDQHVASVDQKGGHWEFWPDDLRVREYPHSSVGAA